MSEQARYSISGQQPGPQNGSSQTAVSSASSQNPKLGSRRLELELTKPGFSKSPERRHATATKRMVGSDCKTCRTMQAGQRSVKYQSCSSLKMQCSQAYASRASPRKARSGSAPLWAGKILRAARDAWLWRRNRGSNKVCIISRCSRNASCASFEHE